VLTTLGPLMRLRLALIRKTFQLRRKLTEAEIQELTAEVIGETKLRLALIGSLTVVWAEIELGLDVTNGVLILDNNVTEKVLPRSLQPKIKFFRKNYAKVPGLAPLADRVSRVVRELDRLRVIRHDAVHGIAIRRLSPVHHEVLRVNYESADLRMEYKSYGLTDLSQALAEMVALKNDLYSLFRDTLFIVNPNAANQAFGQL
jgi:hypothetical protein